MPFLNGEQIMRSSQPFEMSRRESSALTGSSRGEGSTAEKTSAHVRNPKTASETGGQGSR